MSLRILTFDIEDWFHILDHAETKGEAEWARFESRLKLNVDRILQLLETQSQKATFFCLGWVAEHHGEVLRSIVEAGHEVACHSHLHQLVYEQAPKEFAADLHRALAALEDATGQKIRAYRAPGFSMKPECLWAFEKLIEAGIEVDCSIFPAPRAHGGFPDFGTARPCLLDTPSGSLREFPINTATVLGRPVVFSGGGYFRLIPYTLIQRFTEASTYTMTYFHPRDFDPDQPMLQSLGPFRRFKSYVGLRSAQAKLERWLRQQRFVDLATAEAQVDWSRVDRLSLGTPTR